MVQNILQIIAKHYITYTRGVMDLFLGQIHHDTMVFRVKNAFKSEYPLKGYKATNQQLKQTQYGHKVIGKPF